MGRRRVIITETELRNMIQQAIRESYPGLLDNDNTGELNREAYKKGFRYIAYHNTTNKDLTFFDVRTSGIHFGSEKAATQRGQIRDTQSTTNRYFLKIDNPYVIERDFDWEGEALTDNLMDDEEFQQWREEFDPSYYLSTKGFKEMEYDENGQPAYARSIHEMLADEGYDCIVYKNEQEDKGSYSVAMFNPNNIKLAQETYDDSGQPIPLNQRFDTNTDDVRY